MTFAFDRINPAMDSHVAAETHAAGHSAMSATNAGRDVRRVIFRVFHVYGCLHTKFAASSMLPLPL